MKSCRESDPILVEYIIGGNPLFPFQIGGARGILTEGEKANS